MQRTDQQTQDLNQAEGRPTPRSAHNWASPVDQLSAPHAPAGAVNLNVNGRQLAGPLQGFGQLWQKIYRVRLSGARVRPVEVIQVWKEHFPTFWPKSARFYTPFSGLTPGEVALINANGPGNLTLFSTGVMVLYADQESFTFATPQGHPFAGWVTFSAYEDTDSTVAQAQVLLRANDPLYELGFRLGFLHRVEDQTWQHTLTALAKRFGVEGSVQQQVSRLDPRVQWPRAKNLFYNAGLRTALYFLAAPLRWVKYLAAPPRPDIP